MTIKRIFKELYINNFFFYLLGGVVFLAITGHFIPALFIAAKIFLFFLAVLLVIDGLLLFASPQSLPSAERSSPERMSNGDSNSFSLSFVHYYPFKVFVQLIDELPPQFQIRDFNITAALMPRKEQHFTYELTPVKRGLYNFGALNAFVKSPLKLLKRRHRFALNEEIAVYPSFLQMRKYELLAASDFLTEAGIKKIRRISHSNEFDQIRNYVKGDEFRFINWKATARKGTLMVNQYQDEKSQAVYSILDMGRSMEMPFEGMTLLDYAINATLVISNIAMLKHDRAGLITFSNKIDDMLPANRSPKQMKMFMEHLYNVQTSFPEPNYELLYSYIRRKVRQRSLLLLFTNFQGITSVRRQLNFMRMLAKQHLLVVIFFENTGIKEIMNKPAQNTQQVYEKTIAEHFNYEKKMLARELQKHSIQSLLVPPSQLSVETINKYIEMKAKGLF